MANIPVIPGVSVATKGILNKPIKDIICALLFGGLANMLKGPLLCINFDLNKIAEEAGLAGLGDLKAELDNIKDQLKAAEALSGIPETLARVNAAIAEVQSLLALDGLCKIPLKAPKIPDVIAQVIDAEFREMDAILKDLGKLAKPSICLSGNGGLGLGGGYNPDSILGSISKHVGNMGNIPGAKLDALVKRLKGVGKALDKSINRQLFPDFRHKHDLTTGKPYVAGGGPTLAGPPAVQWNPPYPPADAPNLKSATATAQTLVASVKQTGSYPVKADGITNVNPWLPMLGPEVYSLAVNALTPQDPFFSQQEPIYDYCGKLVGYTSTVVSGDVTAIGGNPTADAILEPPTTTFDFAWIGDRNCWAVNGVTSEQVVNGRKDTYLNANPTIELHRGYNHTFSIPSIDISGNGVAAEFFVCYVDENLQPRKYNGNIVPFNLGLARLETYELLEDANGSLDESYALERKGTYPTGTTMYFAAEQRVYSGETEPSNPDEKVWWYNLITCNTQRWTDYKSYGETRTSWDETAILQYKSIWEEKYPIKDLAIHEKPYPIARRLSPQNPDYADIKKGSLEEYEKKYKKDAIGNNIEPLELLVPYVSPDGAWEIISKNSHVPKFQLKIPLELDASGYPVKYEDPKSMSDTDATVIVTDEQGQLVTQIVQMCHWESTSPGYWTPVTDADREANWVGSSNTFGAPNADYLAYSNQDGSVFGLFKFV